MVMLRIFQVGIQRLLFLFVLLCTWCEAVRFGIDMDIRRDGEDRGRKRSQNGRHMEDGRKMVVGNRGTRSKCSSSNGRSN